MCTDIYCKRNLCQSHTNNIIKNESCKCKKNRKEKNDDDLNHKCTNLKILFPKSGYKDVCMRYLQGFV